MDDLYKSLQDEGVAPADWSFVFIKATGLLKTGLRVVEAVKEAAKSLHGMKRLERDLAVA